MILAEAGFCGFHPRDFAR